MPDESANAEVEKLLADAKAVEDRKQALIADLLKQKEAAMKEFDEKLAKLGYEGNSRNRSHHRKASPAGADSAAKPKAKA
jgi:hypothetical protein